MSDKLGMGNKAYLDRKITPKTKSTKSNDYQLKFGQINGLHPFQDQVPGAYVLYQARRRPNGNVVYFNFPLAKEMGLIPKDHNHELNKKLSESILDTFAIQIINEYDIINKRKFKNEDVLPHPYMATRYLQLQHPGKTGKTSGDGRSIWNGRFVGTGGSTWDVSSCGTGATCLSPASAIKKKFFKTGDPQVSYGCGLADMSDGLAAVLMSEIFHAAKMPTERTLAVIEFPGRTAINVRAGKNLLRPSHIFNHLKQNNLSRLTQSVNYYIERQSINKVWPKFISKNESYEFLLKEIAEKFAYASARFERDYVFCWMDWDGDNILMDGGIIDYGSVRQFGLCYDNYRYDDVQRMSTNLPEQKYKAKYIVQTFLQIVDYIKTGKKKKIQKFKNHKCLKDFDSHYQYYMHLLLLQKIGLNEKQCNHIIKNHSKLLKRFEKVFDYFEKMKTSKGPVKVEDGENWDAVYCMRNILRELPKKLYSNKCNEVIPEEFLRILKSEAADKQSMKVTPSKQKAIKEFVELYQNIVEYSFQGEKTKNERQLKDFLERSAQINAYEKITGDGILKVTTQILRYRKDMSSKELHHLVDSFIQKNSESKKTFEGQKKTLNQKETEYMQKILKTVKDFSEGI